MEQLIDPALWDAAKWKAVAFGAQAGKPPLMAFIFANINAGRQIFAKWREAIGGDIDKEEMIRIAIIEGDIPGEPAGYTGHVTPQKEQVIAETLDAEVDFF